MSYLITCSGSKRCPINNGGIGDINLLYLNEDFIDIRNELIQLNHIDLNWNYCLPAWKLYSGNYSRLYPQVSEDNWTKPTTDVKILSALFGWIKHTDLIPYYDLAMTDTIPNTNIKVNLYWLETFNLGNYINPKQDIDLLSKNYRKALDIGGNQVAIMPGVQFTDRGVQKGIWLNKQLDLL